MNCGVVIVAAGKGNRLGRKEHKALVPLGDRPLLFHCLERFASVSLIQEVVLVIHPDDRDILTSGKNGELLRRYGVEKLVDGGERRQDSVLLGLRALSADQCEGALVHDAARPFVSPGMIAVLAKSLGSAAGVLPAIRATSTVKRVDEQDFVKRTENRKDLWMAQTPQAARRDLLIECLEKAREDGAEVTDDVQALENYNYRVRVLEDSPWNFKVTTPEDLALAELVLQARPWEVKS